MSDDDEHEHGNYLEAPANENAKGDPHLLPMVLAQSSENFTLFMLCMLWSDYL
jgi:hypothetical protein